MRWLILIPLFFLNPSCIYTEGSIIREPEDVIVSSKAYQLTPWHACQHTDVTHAKHQGIRKKHHNPA